MRSFFKAVIRFLVRLVFHHIPIKKKLIVMWSFNGKQYGGNPKYISEFIKQYSEKYRIIWLKDSGSNASFPDNINVVSFNSLKHIFYINVAEFVITDNRSNFIDGIWIKRTGQKYIMTWHGGIGNKRIEGDALDRLPSDYVLNAKIDSQMADLFLSSSKFLTEQFRRAFWYSGEVLEKGMPAYDLFFDKERTNALRVFVRQQFDISSEDVIMLYAPTFRKERGIEPYRIDWKTVIENVKMATKHNVFVFLKLHPVFLSENYDVSSLISCDQVVNVTNFGDITPLMCASDLIISDYSATAFEMALLNKPTFLYAVDSDVYDRGFYFPIRDLPFPFASNEKQLVNNIVNFSGIDYEKSINNFYKKVLGVFDSGIACRSLLDWMDRHSLKS